MNNNINITSNKHNSYKEKTEYINGSIVLHSDDCDKHNMIILKISTALNQFFSGKDFCIKNHFEIKFDEKNKFKPDVLVMYDNPKMNIQNNFTYPILVFEVLSRSIDAHDKVNKFYIYMKYGIKEYNLVEQNGFINQYTLIDGWYEQTNAFKIGEDFKSTAFENLNINMSYIFK